MKKIIMVVMVAIMSSVMFAETLSVAFNATASYNLVDSDIINTKASGRDFWLVDTRTNSNSTRFGVDFYLFDFVDIGFGIESRQEPYDCETSVIPNFFPYYIENNFMVSLDMGKLIPGLSGLSVWFKHDCAHPEMPFYFGNTRENQYKELSFRDVNYEGFGISYKTNKITLF